MIPDSKRPNRQQEPPGNRFKKLAKRSAVCRSVLTHTHVLQIIDDHQLMWFEAKTDAEKRLIEARLTRQIQLCMVNVVGFETFVHGAALLVIGDPLIGGVLLVAGAATMHITTRGI